MQLAQAARSGFAAIVFAAAGGLAIEAAAQDAGGTFIGDVPYVATPKDVVETMLDLAKVGPGDYLIDLGSGDGRLVVAAALRGAEGFGVDLDPKRIAESRENARKAGVADRAQFFQRDLFETDFTRATVLTMYLLPDINLQLRPKVLGLKPGTRVVSHDFDMGDWVPDERVRMVSRQTHYESNAYLWIVPAKAGGRWQSDNGMQIEIAQNFQRITVRAEGAPAADARLVGDRIGFSLGGRIYDGRIDGDIIKGVARAAAGETPWTARRAASP